MERLTHFNKGLYFDSEGYNRSNGETDKLGKLEDLEEELGCSLEVVFKAITQGISYELKNGMMESEPCCTLAECGYGFVLNIGISSRRKVVDGEFQTKDYKKTWWLKEDKSE